MPLQKDIGPTVFLTCPPINESYFLSKDINKYGFLSQCLLQQRFIYLDML